MVFELKLEILDLTGEKEGWVCGIIPSVLAQQLNPNVMKTYRIRGKIDTMEIEQKAIIPIGEGDYILPFNAEMRRCLRKKEGDKVLVEVEVDHRPYPLSEDLLACIEMDDRATEHWETLTPSHKKYFSNWVEQAKTIETKTKRITRSLFGLAHKMDYGEMMRHFKGK